MLHKRTYLQNGSRLMNTENRLVVAKRQRVAGRMEWEGV